MKYYLLLMMIPISIIGWELLKMAVSLLIDDLIRIKLNKYNISKEEFERVTK